MNSPGTGTQHEKILVSWETRILAKLLNHLVGVFAIAHGQPSIENHHNRIIDDQLLVYRM